MPAYCHSEALRNSGRPGAPFFDHSNRTHVSEAVRLEPLNGRWFIRLGFAGFNTRANNRGGYATREAAEKVVLKLQGD